MLVLSRRENESIIIDGRIRVVVSRIAGGRVRIAIDAPADVQITRPDAGHRPETKVVRRREAGSVTPFPTAQY